MRKNDDRADSPANASEEREQRLSDFQYIMESSARRFREIQTQQSDGGALNAAATAEFS